VVVAAGAALVHLAGRQLVRSRVGLFGVSPGPHLVTTGWYARTRNPMDVGTVAVALGAWLILAVPLMWVVPLAAVVNFVVGVGLYEDRRLLEEFGEEYEEYRARVGKWIPRRSPRPRRRG
jgi:protein-S-isoprenylcysteine O-methyltransferase Ste14